ncbi:MAG TPA: cyclopropane-fatty-acyl-phospholipid synthase family protein [Baekduia sp.]
MAFGRLLPRPKGLTPAAVVRRALGAIGDGELARLPVTLVFWDGSELRNPDADPSAPAIHVERRAIGHLLWEPNQLGLTRAFVSGSLTFDGDLFDMLALRGQMRGVAPDLRALARVVAAAVFIGGIDALRPPRIPEAETRMTGVRHSLRRDRAAIRHHYDISNAFYRLILGPTLVYSCAYFADADESLEAAQTRKLELICQKLRLAEGERLLDVGCGWGSLLIHAAQHHGVRAVGITLSEAQAELARERIRAAGLADQCEVRVADYREIDDGPYDKIASIGMFEHVGADHLDDYAVAIARLLKPGGLALNHGIAGLYSQPAGEKSLLQRYVFPDGELIPVARVVEALQDAGLETRDVESLREHYDLTLRRWLSNLAEHREAAIAEVGIERVRVWELYMTGSALGFADADISINQILVTKRGGPHGLPPIRTFL